MEVRSHASGFPSRAILIRSAQPEDLELTRRISDCLQNVEVEAIGSDATFRYRELEAFFFLFFGFRADFASQVESS